jgi:hypothetical protein
MEVELENGKINKMEARVQKLINLSQMMGK